MSEGDSDVQEQVIVQEVLDVALGAQQRAGEFRAHNSLAPLELYSEGNLETGVHVLVVTLFPHERVHQRADEVRTHISLAPPERVSERIEGQEVVVPVPNVREQHSAMPVSTLGTQPVHVEQLVLDVPLLQMLDGDFMLTKLIDQLGHGELDPQERKRQRTAGGGVHIH